MKYKEETYLNSGFYSRDEEVENYKEKIVQTRKSHKCVNCQKSIEKGNHALYEKGFLDGKPVSAYTCLPCIEEWLIESGQVEPNMDKGQED